MNVGGVSERFMVAVLKTAVSGHRDRGFESHPLRFIGLRQTVAVAQLESESVGRLMDETKKPIRGFQDLDVYQSTYKAMLEVFKNILVRYQLV